MDQLSRSHKGLARSWIAKVILLLCAECYVLGDIYETIYWSPQNPKFRHTKEQFDNGKAYHERAVMPMSYFNVQCPNLVQIDQHLMQMPSKDYLYENIWLVDKTTFFDCNIDRSSKESHLLYKCNPNSQQLVMKYYELKFLRHSSISGESIEINEGTTYYFIATSDGTKGSLNNTSGGHCNDSANSISMRMAVYVCFTNFTDPRCQKQQPTNQSTEEFEFKKDSHKINSTVAAVVAKSAREKSEDIWQILSIAFAVAFGVSFLVNCIFLVVMCGLRKSNGRPSSNISNVEEEPLKSILGEGKKPHGRTCAAL